jgi:hypothetical protein
MKIKKNGKIINLTESDLKRIVKRVIREQEENTEYRKNAESSNVTITKVFNGLDKEPEVLESSNGLETISFPPLEGIPRKGDFGVKPGNSVILYIGQSKFLVIGNIGTLDSNNKVMNEKIGALVIQTRKFTGSGAGSNVIPSPNKLLQVSNLPKLTSDLAHSMGGGSNPGDFFKTYKDMLLKAFKMASVYGIDTTMLDNIAKFDKDVETLIFKNS